MHTVQVLVLRLFVESEQPDSVRGALRAVPDGETYAFADEKALIVLLRQMAGRACVALEPAQGVHNSKGETNDEN